MGVAVVFAALLVGVWSLVDRWPDEKRDVYSRYNDSLVAGRLDAAWSLSCPADRDAVPLEEFTHLFEQAVRPLGTLECWSRLRGGARWNGTERSLNALPRLGEEDGTYCVHLGGGPLGDPF